MRGIAVFALVAALVVSGAALASRGDPQKRITPADQARAKSMLLRMADFNAAFVSRPNPSSGSGDFYCSALDESDLTLTGQAKSPSFATTGEVVTSTAYVYASQADSNASWKRGTSSAGEQCLRVGLRRELSTGGARLTSFKRLPFPSRGRRSVAFRAVATQQGIRVYVDLIAIQVTRAQASVGYITALSPPPAGEVRRLTALVATRAEKAMRGAS